MSTPEHIRRLEEALAYSRQLKQGHAIVSTSVCDDLSELLADYSELLSDYQRLTQAKQGSEPGPEPEPEPGEFWIGEKWVSEGPHPGSVRDVFFVVPPAYGYKVPLFWRITAYSSYSPRDYWEREHGYRFERAKTGPGRPFSVEVAQR